METRLYDFILNLKQLATCGITDLCKTLLGRRQANLCFHFARSGEHLPDIAKSRDATMRNKLFGCQLKNLMK